MRQNPHVRICGGPGSATTLVYPTAFLHGLTPFVLPFLSSQSLMYPRRPRPGTNRTALKARRTVGPAAVLSPTPYLIR